MPDRQHVASKKNMNGHRKYSTSAQWALDAFRLKQTKEMFAMMHHVVTWSLGTRPRAFPQSVT
jgi:hypothetical protein